jgi:hypothetical protein
MRAQLALTMTGAEAHHNHRHISDVTARSQNQLVRILAMYPGVYVQGASTASPLQISYCRTGWLACSEHLHN